MAKIGAKNMVFKTEEEEHNKRLSCKPTIDKAMELFLKQVRDKSRSCRLVLMVTEPLQAVRPALTQTPPKSAGRVENFGELIRRSQERFRLFGCRFQKHPYHSVHAVVILYRKMFLQRYFCSEQTKKRKAGIRLRSALASSPQGGLNTWRTDRKQLKIFPRCLKGTIPLFDFMGTV